MKPCTKLIPRFWVLIIILTALFCKKDTNAQSCLPGGISFTTQGQIDAFPFNFPGCSHVLGSITITDGGSGNISNVNALAQLTAIDGGLQIFNNPSLINLEGLNSLNTIGLYLNISNNQSLITVSAFGVLASIGSDLGIYNNNELVSISGFNHLNSIGGYLIFTNNPALINIPLFNELFTIGGQFGIYNNSSLEAIEGFNAASIIGGYFNISNNSSLINIEGFDALMSINGSISIYGNNDLTSISGLNSVTYINGDLLLSNHAVLTNLSAFEYLNSIEGSIEIYSNPHLLSLEPLSLTQSIAGEIVINDDDALTGLAGLDNIDFTSITDLHIQNSNLLSTCNVQSICNYLDVPSNPAFIQANATGCNTRLQVEMSCVACFPVSIVIQPQDQSVQVGNTATFSVKVNGTPPFTFQWYKNGIAIPSATQDTYTTPPLNLADNGNTYYCIITNCNNNYTITSDIATLTVTNICIPVLIVIQPQNQTALVGSTATFSVKVSGSSPFVYVWYKNGVPIPGAIDPFYTTPVLTILDNGNMYYCVISNCNHAFTVTSNTATLTVTLPCAPVSIAAQPQNQSATVGSTATFNVSVSGSSPFNYKWYKNGVLIQGSNSSSYTTPILTISDNGNTYYCKITNCNNANQVISNTVMLTVTNQCLPVSISTQPHNQTASVGSMATFFVVVNGTGPFIYSWYKNGNQIPGASGSSYITPVLTLLDNGNKYKCIITNCNAAYQAVSTNALLIVTNSCTAVSITTQPQNQTAPVGGIATFSVSVDGSAPFLYFWYKNNNIIPGAVGSSYQTPVLTLLDNGNVYKCIIINCDNSYQATSHNATLNVTSLCTVSISSNPTNQSVIAPNPAYFSVSVNGTGPFTYQWQVSVTFGSSWSNLSNSGNNTWTTAGNSSTLTLANSTGLNNRQYRCIISNACPSTITSGSATLNVSASCSSVSITSQPLSQTQSVPNPATFSVSVTGASPSYTWQYLSPGGSWGNLNNLGNTTWTAGGSTSTLTVHNTTGLNNYKYRCVISNSCPSYATSSPATLSLIICDPITITSQPTPQFPTIPNPVTFSVIVTGSSPVYQWQFLPPGGTIWTNLNNVGNTTWTIAGNTSTLTIQNTTGLNGYSYHCIISNACSTPKTSGPGEIYASISSYTVSTKLPYTIYPFSNPYTLAFGNITNPAPTIKICADGSNATIVSYTNYNASVNSYPSDQLHLS